MIDYPQHSTQLLQYHCPDLPFSTISLNILGSLNSHAILLTFLQVGFIAVVKSDGGIWPQTNAAKVVKSRFKTRNTRVVYF
jgi:hypothetical protein